MIRTSLREALARVADTPTLWITGLFLGSLFCLDILLQVGGNTLLGARIGFLGICALPFFLGGSYGAIRSDGKGIRVYLGGGARNYFRILLAGAVIVSAALFTAFLAMVPFTILGGSPPNTLSFIFLGVGIPFAFFTFFFDTAAALEDRKVLDSIRRSVEFVTGNLKAVVSFYLANLAIGLAILFGCVAVWSFVIADRLEPLALGNQTVFQNLTAGDLVNLIGIPSLGVGVIIGFLAVLAGGTFLVSFKACFFRRMASSSGPPVQQGEFDEKGRWYRY
jgi:hypothetical protein